MSEAIDKANESKAEAEAKSKHLGTVDTHGGFGAGAGGGFGLNAPGHGPPPQSFAGKADGKKAIEISSDVVDAWKRIHDDAQPDGWLVMEYSADGKHLELKASGPGGLKDFKEQLVPDAVAWGGFRCYGVDKRGDVVAKRAKFVFVNWMPEGVSQVKKAKCGPHKGDVKQVLEGAHLDLMIETTDELMETDLINRLQAATGAHKPNGYEFEEGVFIEADYYGLGVGSDCKGETAGGGTGES